MTTTMLTGHDRRQRRSRSAQRARRWRGWAGLAAAVVGASALLFVTSRAGTSDVAGQAAPGFTLPSTDGRIVSLGDLRGGDVLLYFNEGVGCDVCFDQMAQIESAGVFDGSDLTVLPVVVNDVASVQQQLERFGIRTPFLVDPQKEIAAAYDTLGRGHHADLPGHTFVLVDETGSIAWRGDYPGMWVDPAELADEVDAAR